VWREGGTMLIADYIAIGGVILCALLMLWRLGVVR
jgi:hypothetical protein